MSGSAESEKVLMPRMRMRDPLPTIPVPGKIATPGARPLIRSWTEATRDDATTSATCTFATEFPIARFSWVPAVPVTTICSSSTARSLIAKRMSVAPTRAACEIDR